MSTNLTVLGPEDRTATAWVCVDCMAAVAGITAHEAGHPLPIPFAGDDSVTDPVNGRADGCEHWDTPWQEWSEQDVDEHTEQCETITFSTSLCESCWDTDAGSRHAITITVR